jgi:RNA polymerase sigma-70 factor (ECF subfamily)
LCERYWYPLYAYVRRRGYDQHQAQDLTQSFFVRLLEKGTLAAASPERGRFRTFLLTVLKHFLANEWDREHAQKRGGDRQRLALDYAAGESRWSFEPADLLTPERAFERQWALTLLDAVVARLHEELVQAGKGKQFELLKETLLGDRAAGAYAAAAAELNLSEEAVRQAAHRLRKRFRELLRAEVAQTVAAPDEIDDEIRSLFAALET